MAKSEYIHQSYPVSLLLYHYLLPAKYRRRVERALFTGEIAHSLKEIWLSRYFGADIDGPVLDGSRRIVDTHAEVYVAFPEVGVERFGSP